ncbi:lmo0937 family membrane protein [Edaphobacter flagellatus]|nr:lmo0937 family membrane protein [Edaphobacter flagellatus]
MFLILAIVLVALWLGGFLVFKTAGIFIHLLLILAVLSIIMHFVSGRRSV